MAGSSDRPGSGSTDRVSDKTVNKTSSPRQSRTRTGRGRSFLSKMWLGGGDRAGVAAGAAAKPDLTVQHQHLFTDLYYEVRLAAPSAQLSYSLRSRLERVERNSRRGVVSRTKDGCSPLFLACKKGNVEIVEYLLTECHADLEQRGQYEVHDDRSVHTVTPLWCAAVAGKYQIVELLVNFGADVNSMSDTGSTPVRSACFMTHLEIVKLLVTNGADIQKPNFNGGTCLINSVQSVELCEFLLKHGANVNAQDIQCKTALHYAIQEHRFETAKLLLTYGADPYLESRYKDDALQTACLKGASIIFQYLIDNLKYSSERISSAFELIGSTFLDEHHDSQRALQYWRAACQLREKANLTKQIKLPKWQFRFATEFVTRAELDTLALDLDQLRLQSLLISERILGLQHKDMIYKLMYRGAAYADSLQYQHCIDLWKYALELRIAKDTILYCDTCFTAQALVKLFLDLQEKHKAGVLVNPIRVEDVIHAMELLLSDFSRCISLLEINPVFKTHQSSWDKILKIMTHLLYLVLQLPMAEERRMPLMRQVHRLLRTTDPRTTSGDSLLHLAVMQNNSIKTTSPFVETNQFNLFPSIPVTEFLLDCGASVNATNKSECTPLHVACEPTNFKQQIVEILLEKGAHIDMKDKDKNRPSQLLASNPESAISVTKYMTLKCLCAQVISESKMPYKGEVPEVLETFIEAH